MGLRTIFVKLNNIVLDNYNTYTRDRRTLAGVPVNAEPFSMILYENKQNSASIVKSKQLPQTLEVNLTDENNNFIDFNNTEWTIVLEVQNYYLVSSS
jgi:hypothetical protein